MQLYNRAPENLESPSALAAAVTPHDSTNLSYISRGLYVGTTGNVSVEMADGGTVVFTAVPAGAILPVQVTRVNSTNTTASTIVVLY